MPIQKENIKFLASQVMDDVPEGGGAATGNEIPDGVMNNVFPDISDLDRAMGRFNLRKLFLAIRTLSTDLFGGAKTVVTALPEDPAIGYTLFTTNDPFDTRADAVDRVEAYLFKGPMWPGALYENHIEGMRQIRVIQREGAELPPLGRTLCLVQFEGEPSEREQYVRVTDVSADLQTFSDNNGNDYERMIVTMDLSDALRFDFDGHTPNRQDSYNYTSKARLRDTSVADATRYFGAQPLTLGAEIGDKTLRAASIFTQLVPAAQSEEPLSNKPLNPELVQSIEAGTRTVEVAQQAHTLAREVNADNRRLNWLETLVPVPAAGAYSISYMAQGNWYTLADDGNGAISGSDPSFGTGTLDYVNGSLSVTLGALPDAGSQIIHTYGSRVHYENRSGSNAINQAEVVLRFALSQQSVTADSVSLSWPAGGVTKTATVAASGAISGDGSGALDPVTGEGELLLTEMPDRGASLTVSYQRPQADDGQESVAMSEALATGASITLSKAAASGTLRLVIPVANTGGGGFTVTARDIGGDLVVPEQRVANSKGFYQIYSEQVIGSVSGTAVTISSMAIDVTRNSWQSVGFESGSADQLQVDLVTDSQATYTAAGVASTPQSETETISMDALQVRLVTGITDSVVSGSVRFELGGKIYDDRQGNLVTDIDTQTGSGLAAGSMDYGLGIAEVTYWEDGEPANLDVTSLLTVYGQWTATAGYFRTSNAPLKPQSLQINVTTEDGEQLVATADQNGEFTHEWIQGTADYTFGIGAVTFGKLVPDASLTPAEKSEWWYDPADVDGDGNIYQPRPVLPDTLRYNAVAFSYLPLDADIVGIDAVRLPSDGRVPIYRPGDVVMVMHPDTTAPQTVANSDVIPTRPRIAWVRVIDANGDAVTDGYSLDRATGDVAFDDVTGVSMPVTVRHTVADLRLVTDVQISGDLTLSRELTHDYPANESIVASCLIHGDRRARVSGTWDQDTWSGTWSDSQQGDEATATLNLIDHPITVTNEGCDTDRWLLRCVNASSGAWELISEKRGLVWTGTYTQGGADIAPINPRTRGEEGQGGVPYMTIPAAANGGGWSTGNVVRINTVGAIADFWIARAIQQSDEPLDDGADGCEIYALGNIDRP